MEYCISKIFDFWPGGHDGVCLNGRVAKVLSMGLLFQ